MGGALSPFDRAPKLTRFDVVRRLGEGGMGVVFEAVDRESSARVALKTLRTFDAETLLRLKEEFRALQDIRHPNLVSLGEMMCDGDTWFFTMELLDGVGLLQHVRGSDPGYAETDEATRVLGPGTEEEDSWDTPEQRPARYDETRLRSSLADLARALLALHAAGKVHRDIKPSNVIVTKDGRVVLLDFGLVLDSSGGAEQDEDFIVGSVPYMAPEQAANEPIGPPADWYAVGVVLYQCLTGRRPFEGASTLVLTRKLTEEPRPPSTHVQGIPPDLEELCVELLRIDPAARPAGPDVLRRMIGRRTSERPPRPSVPPPTSSIGRVPFVGRNDELALLSTALGRVDAGETVCVVVQGESGVGKSALVRRFTQRIAAERADAVVLTGRCFELEVVPYKAFDGLMDALSRHLATLEDLDVVRLLPGTSWLLAQVFPVLRRVAVFDREAASADKPRADAHETRARLFATVRELLTKLGERRRLVLVIDDLHWADPDSLAMLAELLRPPLPPRLMLLLTTRPDPSAFVPPGQVVTLDVGRLPTGDAVELARVLLSRGGGADERVAETIAMDAGGHPLFVDELVRHAREHGSTVPANVHLDDALAERVGRLLPSERQLLEILAVAGVSLTHRTAMRAAGLDVAQFAKHASMLRAAHLARSSGGRGVDAIEPYHDRIRQAVFARLAEETRRGCHERIAVALEQQPEADPDAIATHWIQAGNPERASVYARRAADQAFASLAFERAARLYERALALPSVGDEERRTMAVRRAESLANAGRSIDAASAFRAAAAQTAGEPALELRRRGAEELLIGGRIDEGIDSLRTVLSEVGMRMPSGPIATVLLLLFFRAVLWVRGLGYELRDEANIPRHALLKIDVCWSIARTLAVTDHILGAYFLVRMLLLSLRHGEAVRLANALALEAGYLAVGRPRARVRGAHVLERAYALARRMNHAEALGIATGVEGFSALVQGRYKEALNLTDRALEIVGTNTAGFIWEVRAARMHHAWALYTLGEIKRLTALVRTAVRDADDRGDLAESVVYRTGNLNIAWLCNGDSAAARAIVLDVGRQWTQRGYHNQHYWTFLALTQIDLYEGKGREAYERVVSEWPRLRRGFILEMDVLRSQAIDLRGRAAVLAASQTSGAARARLLRSAERDARTLERIDLPTTAPLALLVRAGVAAVRGDVATAAEKLTNALPQLDAVPALLYAAAARHCLGRLQGGDEGETIAGRADAWMSAEGIADPARISGMLVPGFVLSRDRP